MNQLPMAELGLGPAAGPLSRALLLDPEAPTGAQTALFSSLLGQQISQISPEVLRAALVSLDGEPLPDAGNELPLQAMQTPAIVVSGNVAPQLSQALTSATPASVPGMPLDAVAETGSTPTVEQILPSLASRRSISTVSPVVLDSPNPPNDSGAGLPTPGPVLGPTSIGGEPPSAAVRSATASVDVPVGRPGWDQSLGQRVVWLSEGRQETAELQLNPPHLGPLKVRVELNGDQANVSFSSNHVLVRDAVESAVPRLREMLEASGLSLANVDVSEQGTRERPDAQSESIQAGSDPRSSEESLEGALRVEPGSEVGTGLVDYYV